ncbi:hypothetical protein CROQUDRAFT_657042 [Cronartium quercuum f. sp. fusiforme G11]|uniref:Uncharacterized protein n=1 Tax=Cronartium quercuum f. sp. fusiforme G11 TaxID=708437 RepID=A0A9P6TBW4_9BASI|nr:hypothetical protein CROQUDRAFT_657042 [Cronartium quercuum f. sp. fusiforme G11]
MPSDLRKRRLPELPRTLNNPRPPSPDTPSHTSLNRHKPTIAPTIFIALIFILTALLFPLFYYTQVMMPHPESTSILSHFQREGQKLLSGLGHMTSHGPGRLPFVPHINAPQKADAFKTSAAAVTSNQETTTSPGEKLKSEGNSIDQLRTLLQDAKFRAGLKKSQGLRDVKGSDEDESMTSEERDRLDEELGKYWQASSRYRAGAQKKETGQYAITGDGASTEIEDKDSSKRTFSIDDLPEADPDAKEGLTPEVWQTISEQLTADELTVMLDAVRSKEV